MATEHHPIRTGIIGTVGGGLILAGILSVIGKLPAFVSYVFGVLGTSISLPMWLLGVGLAVIGISTKRRLARWIAPELDDVQTEIMHLFANLDGGRLTRGDISEVLRVSKLLADRALEQLENIALITDDQNYLYGTVFILTSKGRDFVLDRGWVG